jgi:rhamnopyranosyl-N-acetylglucosaminyl-diphospho-decaprenol beta-1,3/1,4-galactofuranosyltransferase
VIDGDVTYVKRVSGMRLCAVIVTFNRPELLIRCVSAVLKQTRRPDAVIVVDNCSDVPAAEILCQFGDAIQVFRFSQNTGGAGGFCFGMAEAFRQDFDAVWLMDDDGMPSTSCLAELLSIVEKTKLGFSNPLVMNEKSPEKLAFGLATPSGLILSTDAALAAADRDSVIEGAINPFNGSLLTRDTYQRLGEIKFECFIWGDEEEYFERARAFEIRVGTVVSAGYYHPIAKSETIVFGPGKSQLKLCPPSRSQFHFRNIGFSKAHYRGIMVACYHALNYLLFLLWSRQWSEAIKFVIYYTDGMSNLYLLNPSRSTLRRLLTQVARCDMARPLESLDARSE